MYKSKKIYCVIPARLHSTRFPKKVLKTLGGRPLLEWVYKAAISCGIFDEIVFAVDAKETENLVRSFGGKPLMTSEDCLNGTERLIDAKKRYHLDADIWVNWQADEPFVKRELIMDLLQSIDRTADVWTLRKKMTTDTEIHNPHVVKVVVDQAERALYFSRSTIPYNFCEEVMHYKHIGIYAFSNEALEKISTLEPCAIERTESLEQLRFLYHGMTIRVHETAYETQGIDLPEHLDLAERLVQLNQELCV